MSSTEPQAEVALKGPGQPGFFSSFRTLSLPVGSRVQPDAPGGYYIDLSRKPRTPRWPPPWFLSAEDYRHAAIAQWGLGAYECYLAGDGEAWLAAALGAAGHLVATQERGGAHDGGWVHRTGMRHTFRVEPPWVSAMAQGEGASLLVRAHAATADERFAEGALRALRPLALPRGAGGVRVALGAGFFLEEYPTDPPSLVLNGGIFALWGYHDVAVALGDADARRQFEVGLDTLAAEIGRWDTGAWSRYDLFPFRVPNVASSFYHALHINQLRAMELIAPRPELASAASGFERYLRSPAHRMRAFAGKAVFRVLVPRNRLLAHRSPFARPFTRART